MAATQPSVVSLGGGLILNKDVFSMSPGEALQLQNFEPDIAGGYKKMLGTTAYNSNIVPQVSSSSEIVLLKVKINELPSFNMSLFVSRTSENMNNSKTLIKSVNFKTAYEFPLAVFLS